MFALAEMMGDGAGEACDLAGGSELWWKRRAVDGVAVPRREKAVTLVGPGSYSQAERTVELDFKKASGKVSSAFASTSLRADSFLPGS